MSTNDKDRVPAGARSRSLLDPVDALIAALLLAGCGFLYYVTTQFEQPGAMLGENLLPADFPRLVLYTIAILAALLPFEHLAEPKRWPKIKASRSEQVAPVVWLTMVFVTAVVLAAPYLGTVLTIFAITLIMPMLWGERRRVPVIIFAVLFTLAITLVFNVLLRVHFEPGLLNIRLR